MGLAEMNISLRRGEKIFINGAVLRVDRKVCLELMNDATFLIENHVMQPDQATSPLKKLYLAIQTVLMSPSDKDLSLSLCHNMIDNLLLLNDEDNVVSCLQHIKEQLESRRVFEALKSLRSLFQMETDQTHIQPRQFPQETIEEGNKS
jgi:flagellar protein FlbT